jgi:hypothetical protein
MNFDQVFMTISLHGGLQRVLRRAAIGSVAVAPQKRDGFAPSHDRQPMRTA